MSNAHAHGAGLSHSQSPHRVLELFAGVGGFHHGLEQVNQQRAQQGLPRAFDVVWANQFEPGCKRQHAASVYEARWGMAPVNRSLFDVLDDEDEMARIDALAPTAVAAGFPCQDYSVAQPASRAEGLQGKKGVLWWGIHRLLHLRLEAGKPIQLLMLENVDRLIRSPNGSPGRDFAIILASLQSLGYAIAWQVVNAADYGYPQKRRRVFITAVHESSPQHQAWRNAGAAPALWLTAGSPLAVAMPVELKGPVTTFELGADILAAQEGYRPDARGASRFASTGLCVDGNVWTAPARAVPPTDCTPYVGQTAPMTLGDVVAGTAEVPESFYLSEGAIARWQFMKGSKSIERISSSGHPYKYSEGAMSFPDALDRPARTVITSEGGAGASRTKHVIGGVDGRLRRLTPEELEVLNGFPRGFTAIAGVSEVKRAFLMGNALVTGLVARIGMAMLGGTQPPKPADGLPAASKSFSDHPLQATGNPEHCCRTPMGRPATSAPSKTPILCDAVAGTSEPPRAHAAVEYPRRWIEDWYIRHRISAGIDTSLCAGDASLEPVRDHKLPAADPLIKKAQGGQSTILSELRRVNTS